MAAENAPALGGDHAQEIKADRKMGPEETREFKLWCAMQRTRPSAKRDRLHDAWVVAKEHRRSAEHSARMEVLLRRALQKLDDAPLREDIKEELVLHGTGLLGPGWAPFDPTA